MKVIGAWHLAGAIVLLSVIAYYPVWNNQFVDYDDEPCILKNPHVLAGLNAAGLRWAWTNRDTPYWMPIAWLSLQFDAEFFSNRPPGQESTPAPAACHAQNLFWHTGTALLLFGFWRRVTHAKWRSFLVAALFAVHPMHVESVAWAIERKDVLMAFFGVLTLFAYVHYTEKPGAGRYAAIIVPFALSLMSKPMLLTLPFCLLLLDFWPLRRLGWGDSFINSRRLITEKIPLLAIAVLFGGITLQQRSGVSFHEIALLDRGMNAVISYRSYLAATFWPTDLCAFYPHPYREWSGWQVLGGAGVILAISTLAIVQARRRRWLLFGWFWFLGTLVPVIGFTQGGAQGWADRFAYWPHIGLFIAIVWCVAEPAAHCRRTGIRAAAGAAILILLVVQTRIQVRYWHDSTTLWEHVLAITERNDRAHEHLAICYSRAGRMQEARTQIDEAVRIQRRRHRLAP